MNIGFLGLGKLGLPVALAIESKGHCVAGYDPLDKVKKSINARKIAYREESAHEYLKRSKIQFFEVEELVRFSEIIFVTIQTPHSPIHEGITRLPAERVDFDYSYLIAGINLLVKEIEKQKKI